MDEWSKKKKLGIVAAVAFVVFLFSLLTDFTPGLLQGWITEHKESPWAPWLEMRLSTLYGVTIRKDKKYECYTKYIELFGPGNPNYNEEAYSRIEMNRAILAGEMYSKTKYLEELQKIIIKYPGRPVAQEAQKRYDQAMIGG